MDDDEAAERRDDDPPWSWDEWDGTWAGGPAFDSWIGESEAEPLEAGDGAPPTPVGSRRLEPPAVAVTLLHLLETATGRLLERPPVPKVRVSRGGLVRGEIDLVQVEVPALLVAGLVVDRFSVRGERLRLSPGLPPRLRAEPVSFRAVVSQANVDRWTHAARLPIRLELTEEGVMISTGLGGVRFGHVVAELDIAGPFLRLRPRRLNILGLPTSLTRFLRGYLPLPPLPKGARLRKVEPSDGELAVTFVIDEVDEPLTPDVARRLGKALGVPLL